MSLVRISLRNPYLVIVFCLLILVIGLMAIFKMPVDLLPTFKTPAVQILTLYPGMPAEVVEKDITSRLERWTGQSNGIARQESKSMIGVSVVKDYFREDIDPNTAMSQVTSLAMSDLYYLPPGTIPPMVMPFDPTASVPLALLSVSSPTFDETKLYDVAYFDLRNRLQGITGVIAPAVYGGKLRRILAYVDPDKLYARRLAPIDVVEAIKNYNLMIPVGNAKFGSLDYQIDANSMVDKVSELNDVPIKVENGAPVFVKDVAEVKDSHQIQTNIVRVDGKRQVYIPIYRQPGANTIAVVDGVKEAISTILSRLPKGINLDVVLDQSVYVRHAIKNLVHEGILGALLACGMILLFLGSFRSTLAISLSIPLSILAAFIGLYYSGNSVNAMTLGGLALAVGRLVDDAIVVLENTHRHVAMGKAPGEAAQDAAAEVAAPVLVATITTVVVFFPISFMAGIGKFLFMPLALSVGFAMMASYVLSMTLIPAFCARYLQEASPTVSEREPWGFAERVDRLFAKLQDAYGAALSSALRFRGRFLLAVAAVFLASLALVPSIGRELFPKVDAGQFTIQVRANSGRRVEDTEKMIARVEQSVRNHIPKQDIKMVISNIGVLYDWPAAYTPNAGPHDSFILVQLEERRSRSAQEYAALLRRKLSDLFPGVSFAFDTGGMLTAALNSGLPSPIDIQIEGNKLDIAQGIAEGVRDYVAKIPGTADVRIQQQLDYPQIGINVDRTRAAYLGLTQEQVVKNVVTATNSSINFDPSFWIDNANGNHYFIGAQYPEERIKSIATLKNIPITSPLQDQPVLLGNLATFDRRSAPAEVHHHNINRVTDVYVNVEGRDVGSVAAQIQPAIDGMNLPSGYFVRMRGEVASMSDSFRNLGIGLILASILVYLVLVAQFRSFLDPFIVMFAVPLGLIGVILILLLTNTAISIQSLMGVIFMVGISVSNSILLVDFANRLKEGGAETAYAALEAARVRLRPILMTSIAAILGLLPMAIGIGRGGEANIPLARAVVGGLSISTVLTIFVVPLLYTLFKRPESARR
ncbi:MAG: efflux RND transporter permease subunit [Armatimonadetes bacterium]|nr:efflux RND transporter permease subunit [Armatimonadota bacterium]